MSTELLLLPISEALGYREPDLYAGMASQISDLYGTQDGLNARFHDSYTMPSSHTRSTGSRTSISRKSVPTTFDSHMPSSLPSAFIPSNAMQQTQDTAIASLQLRYAPNGSSPQSDTSSSFDLADVSHSPSYEGIQHVTLRGGLPTENPPSPQNSGHSNRGPRRAPRKRVLETVEAGTPRAVYLEKNRKAANKCRSKQKQQQENLVEEARNQELRNKLLKAEIEMLRTDLHQLMNIVAHHTECPDSRLSAYVQREADRLAAGRNARRQRDCVSTMSPGDGRHISPLALSPSIGLR